MLRAYNRLFLDVNVRVSNGLQVSKRAIERLMGHNRISIKIVKAYLTLSTQTYCTWRGDGSKVLR